MPKPKSRKNVDENFKLAAVQRLQAGVPANELAKELDVSIWSLRKWSRKYRNRATAGAVGDFVGSTTRAEELPVSLSTQPVAPPVADGELRLRSHGSNRRFLHWISSARHSNRRSKS